MIIDADSHLKETRHLWAEYAPTANREKIFSVVDDDNGYAWLAVGGEKTNFFLWSSVPGDWKTGAVAAETARARAGQRSERPYDAMPVDHWNYQVRRDQLAAWGVDASIVFPQWTLFAEGVLKGDREAIELNLGAWNRYAVDVQGDGGGRLYPAGILHFSGDFSWAQAQLAALSRGGVRIALMPPALVNSKRLSHPDNERIWQLFLENGITPVWHINTSQSVVSSAWTDDEPGWYKVLEASFSRVQPQLAVSDLAIHGVFERYPSLRLALIEYRPDWLPQLMFRLDNSYLMRRTHHGAVLTPELTMKPSEYILRQCRFGVFPEENPVQLAKTIGAEKSILMWGGDYPHAEGYDDPFRTYENMAHVKGTPIEESLYGGNAAEILGLSV